MNTPIAVVHIPHASTVVPAASRSSMVLRDDELMNELLTMTDHFTDKLFRMPPDVAATVKFPVSRLVVDPERFVDDGVEPMSAVGMGVIYTRTSRGQRLRRDPSPRERDKLLATYYFPHHQRLTEAVAAAIATHDRCLVVDAHSFPSRPLPHEADQHSDRCHICVGTDAFHTPRWLTEFAVQEFQDRGFDVEINRPFGGSLVPAKYHGRDKRVLSVMVEVNRSLYMEEASGERLDDFEAVAASLRQGLLTLIAAMSS